jgi:hypothetical protein
VVQFELTPKALANVSPGLPQPWDLERKASKTLKALGLCDVNSCRVEKNGDLFKPRVETNPGLTLANAFGVKIKLTHYHRSGSV